MKYLFTIIIMLNISYVYSNNVKFIYKNNEGQEKIFCNGIFISKNIISAPAHCVKKAQSLKKTRNFSSYLRDENNNKIKVKRILIHKDYNCFSSFIYSGNDASIIITKDQYDYNDQICNNECIDQVEICINEDLHTRKIHKITDTEIFIHQKKEYEITNGDSGNGVYNDNGLVGLVSRNTVDKEFCIITRIKEFFSIEGQYDEK